MDKITTLFDKIFHWDIYIYGILWGLVLIIGLSLWIYTLAQPFVKKEVEPLPLPNPPEESSNTGIIGYIRENYRQLYELITITNLINPTKYIPTFIITFTIIYLLGINANSFADDVFMENPDSYHLGFKTFWLKDSYSKLQKNYSRTNPRRLVEEDFKNYAATEDYIRFFCFFKIFNSTTGVCDKVKHDDEKDAVNLVRQIYFQAKHQILDDKTTTWVGYITYSQDMVNATQVSASAFFALFTMSLLNFLFDFLRLLREFFAQKPLSKSAGTLLKYMLNFFVIFHDTDTYTNDEERITVNKIKSYLGLFLSSVIISFCFYLYDDSHSKVSYLIVSFLVLCFISLLGSWVINRYYLQFGRRFKATLYVCTFSLLAYIISASTWRNYSQELALKTFGVFKFLGTKNDPAYKNALLKSNKEFEFMYDKSKVSEKPSTTNTDKPKESVKTATE